MATQYLDARALKALRNKPAPKGKRIDVMDTVVPGFGVRINDQGRLAFILNVRFPGKKHPERRTLGRPADKTNAEAGVFTLADARAEAQRWRGLVGQGIDPREEAERRRQENTERRANTFGAVAEDFIKEKLPSERRGKEAERDLRREFMPRWEDKPIGDITDLDVLALIKAKRETPVRARNLLALAKRFFTWVIDQRVYGLKVSPAGGLRPRKIITGASSKRTRVLSDDELFAIWRATERLGYPVGTAYQTLMLAALRLNEAVRAQRKEIDRRNGIWVVPAERMKARNEVAVPHAVPLLPEMVGIFDQSTNKGAFIFSTTMGAKPVWCGDKVKTAIDARMLRTLRALARLRGDDPSQVELQHWVNHDIRRTVRTNLSKLRVPEEVREAVLAHVRPGIKGTYDHHDYFDEKAEALGLWAARLRAIIWSRYREIWSVRQGVKPAESNVIRMRA